MSSRKTDNKPEMPGINRQMVLHALAGYNLSRVDTKDVAAIEKRISDYLGYCVENDVAPSVAGCANWLGVNVRTVEAWYTGYRGSPEHQRIASNFYGILQDVWAQKMDTGTINPVSGIFMSKAFFGYKDTQEIVIQHTAQNEQLSNADLIAQARMLPGAETLALPEGTQTIDAEYRVVEKPVEDDPDHEKAVERHKKIAERKEAIKAYQPIKKAKKKEYLKGYYREHKEEQLERNRRSIARKKAEKEKAQKEAFFEGETGVSDTPGLM